MDDIENLSIVFLGYESRKSLALAIRKHIRSEYQPVAFVDFDADADIVKIQIFIEVNGEHLVSNAEFNGDVVEELGWDGVISTVSMFVEDGFLDE